MSGPMLTIEAVDKIYNPGSRHAVHAGRALNLAMKSERLDRETVARRVQEIARLLDIESLLDRYPSSISGGQQQRAGRALVLVRKADLFLLDEPMGQLQPQLRAPLRGRIKHFIKERGMTAILVTHDQTEANALADRIAVMEGGELQQFDTPERLRERPANLFTGTFIGEPPMNVFAAAAAEAADRLVFRLGGEVEIAFDRATLAARLRDAIPGRPRVTLGVRPHAVRIEPGGAPARVYTSQWPGDQTLIAAHFAGSSIVSVRHDRVHHGNGETIGIALAPADLHLFDSETGRAISHGGALA